MEQTGKINIGNVTFSKNDVQKITQEVKDGQKLNCVFLQNGTKLSFPDQKADSNASAKIGIRDILHPEEAKKTTSFFGIQGLSIEGSKNDDLYNIWNCDGAKVDVSGGGRDVVNYNDGQNIQITSDADDTIKEMKTYTK